MQHQNPQPLSLAQETKSGRTLGFCGITAMPSASGSSGGGVPPPSTTGDGRLGTGARGAGAGRAPMAPFAPEDAQVGVQLTEMNSFFTLLHTWLLPGASPANTGSERLKKWGPGTHHHTYGALAAPGAHPQQQLCLCLALHL